jgi:mersacidin/lichenicidin family type 2 lantibiotic
MVDDIVKAWRDPYFREVEARVAAVTPHPAGEISGLELETIVGGEDEESILTFWGTCCQSLTCPTTTGGETCVETCGWCQTFDSRDSFCCCPTTNNPDWCI